MIVITADQIDSTHRADLVGETVDALNTRYGHLLPLPVDRNAGDEIQAMVDSPEVALAMILELLRGGAWSVGCGIGAVRLPVATSTRAAAGSSFVAARSAVNRAKKAPHRFALDIDDAQRLDAEDIEPLVELLLLLRSKRSAEGWELFDLLAAGATQSDAATALGISPQAASQRARAAGIRTDLASLPPLARLIGQANEAA
jgi:hypothetical protein